jgi:glycerol-3-phosphate dehydrogenase (NAD(P)+)
LAIVSRRVSVIGAGSWGTTVAALAAAQGEVALWARNPEVVREINSAHRNSQYLGDHELPHSIHADADLLHVSASADVIAMAIPAKGFAEIAESVAAVAKDDSIVVSLTKGLEPVSGRRMSEVLQAAFPRCGVAVLSGPNLASEIIAGQPAASVVASTDDSVAREVVAAFSTPVFRLYTNDDVVGCEIGGVVKNVIAIGAGIAQGFGFGDNAKAAVITRGLAEMTRLGVALGARPETFSGLAGIGDLVATCASMQSRNTQVGVRLGRGESPEAIEQSMQMVAEGVRASSLVVELARGKGVEMPISEQVALVCQGRKSAGDALVDLLSRRSKAEFS